MLDDSVCSEQLQSVHFKEQWMKEQLASRWPLTRISAQAPSYEILLGIGHKTMLQVNIQTQHNSTVGYHYWLKI